MRFTPVILHTHIHMEQNEAFIGRLVRPLHHPISSQKHGARPHLVAGGLKQGGLQLAKCALIKPHVSVLSRDRDVQRGRHRALRAGKNEMEE